MGEENGNSNEYGVVESTETDIPEIMEIMEREPKIEDDFYGKNKPRRVIIDREILHE